MARRKRFRTGRGSLLAMRTIISQTLELMGANPALGRLSLLWSQWDEILGELAPLAQPLGAQGKTLLVRADNSMHMQELQFHAEEILSLANAFLQNAYFEQIRFSIHKSGKKCRKAVLTQADKAAKNAVIRSKANCASLTGKYLKNMDKDSPVARCYAAFLKNRAQGA